MSTSISIQKANLADARETFEAALLSLFTGKVENTESDLEKIFHPDFTFRDSREDGLVKHKDYADWVKHVKFLRTADIGLVDFKIVQFLRDGSLLAERHIAQGKGPDGKVVQSETMIFAEIAEDGRVKSIVENVNLNEPVKK
ncbi:hypothetical protein CkaCkLH20_07342 [Colletotrichum karsti]|uniref:SnoaL-like domain-containing protein n=1 Tax=Colletotrichum karsti TaxID=1095194 RepID=A0A9P6I6V5_9PEZI|nr:uncharacterized protein CkaCkLH20_07342 [Colletotrichum karsti]KAF9875076.1 hypothetical protein CkaCkLH20_07342 [Colletotrichum karsti]